jgi:hypothetical protein
MTEPARKQIERQGLYRLNLVNPDDDTDRVADERARKNVGSVGDWELHKRGFDVCKEEGEITPATIADEFYDSSARTFDYDAMRDRLAEIRYSGEEHPARPAGQAIGSIRRFIEEMNEGTFVLGNFPDGQVPGVVTGPAQFEPEFAEEDPSDHVFVREIEWARNDRGDLAAIHTSILPPKLAPGRQTVTKVGNEGLEQIAQLARMLDVFSGEP